MFWKQRHRPDAININPLDAREVVSQVGNIYANLTEQGQVVKPRSSLPRSWFAVRECFMIAYKAGYLQLPENMRNAFHHVYRELAFFVDDDLCSEFNSSLNVAAKCRSERFRQMGVTMEESYSRSSIASTSSQGRKEIWEDLTQEKTCPRNDLLLLVEVLSYCGEMHRAMWDEWSAFANLVAYRQKTTNGKINPDG